LNVDQRLRLLTTLSPTPSRRFCETPAASR
jgi:hypothetical protein